MCTGAEAAQQWWPEQLPQQVHAHHTMLITPCSTRGVAPPPPAPQSCTTPADRLTQGIVQRGAQLRVLPNALHQQQQVVAARDEQAEERELNRSACRCCFRCCRCHAGYCFGGSARRWRPPCRCCCCLLLLLLCRLLRLLGSGGISCKAGGPQARHQCMGLHVVDWDERQAVGGSQLARLEHAHLRMGEIGETYVNVVTRSKEKGDAAAGTNAPCLLPLHSQIRMHTAAVQTNPLLRRAVQHMSTTQPASPAGRG